MFYNTNDRIDIIKIYKRVVGGEIRNEERLQERCYNVRKVGTAGICQTKRDTRTWGFCSRSCTVKPEFEKDEPYEEAEFKYFEEPPEGSAFAGFKVLDEYYSL